MANSKHPITDLQPVLDAIADLKADVSSLKTDVSSLKASNKVIIDAVANLAVRFTRLEAEMVDEISGTDDAAEKLKRNRASQLRGGIASPR